MVNGDCEAQPRHKLTGENPPLLVRVPLHGLLAQIPGVSLNTETTDPDNILHRPCVPIDQLCHNADWIRLTGVEGGNKGAVVSVIASPFTAPINGRRSLCVHH